MAEKKKSSWVYTPKEINTARGLRYGLTDLMGGGWNNIVSGVIFVFVLSQGISPLFTGAVLGIGRIIDAIWSLFFGAITDRFYRTRLGKRFGRRHFWIAVGGVLFAILFPMFWISTTSWQYYLWVYVAIEVAISMILIPWETLPTEMTPDYKKRTTLSGNRMFISATGTAIVFFTLAVLKSFNNPNAYLYTGITWTIIFVIAIFTSWRSTWERPLTPEFLAELDAQPRLGFGGFLKKTVTDYFGTFKNKSFRKHLLVYLLSFTGKDFYSTLLPTFIVVGISGMSANSPWILQALSAFGILSTIAAVKIMVSHGPKYLFTLSYVSIIIAMIGYFIVYMTGVSDPMWMLIIVSILYQLGRGILEFTPWNVFPFIPDVDRIYTHGDKAGVYASVMTFFRKSTGALATYVAGWLLEAIGFDSATMTTHANTPLGIQHGIMLIFIVVPIVLIALALIAARTFKLNRENHDVLKSELKRLEDGGSKADVTPKAREVVEMLTGHPYDECWPDEADI